MSGSTVRPGVEVLEFSTGRVHGRLAVRTETLPVGVLASSRRDAGGQLVRRLGREHLRGNYLRRRRSGNLPEQCGGPRRHGRARRAFARRDCSLTGLSAPLMTTPDGTSRTDDAPTALAPWSSTANSQLSRRCRLLATPHRASITTRSWPGSARENEPAPGDPCAAYGWVAPHSTRQPRTGGEVVAGRSVGWWSSTGPDTAGYGG